MLKRVAVTLIGLSFVSTAGLAQKTVAPNHNVGDPNERICEKLTMVGSRLAVKTVCATRAEWAEKKQQDREAVERAQKLVVGPCQTTGGKTAC